MIHYVENYQVKEEAETVVPFFRNYINIMVLFFPLTSFLLIPAVQGTTVITVLTALLFGVFTLVPAGANKGLYFKQFFIFLMLYILFSVISQSINLFSELKLDTDLVLVNKGNYLDSFYRMSHFTQTLYLVIAFILYLFVKYYADISLINYVYWAIRFLCFYALYEFFYFLATGASGDFVTNRQFADVSGSSFQLTNIAGVVLLRIKGYTGEPSMFTFTILPFWALSYGLKRKFDRYLTLICLLLTLSTTAYFSIVLFNAAWFIYKKRYKQIVYVMIFFVCLLAVLQLDAFREVTNSIYDFVFGVKLSGEAGSSQQREGNLLFHTIYWTHLNLGSKLFGIGFGYIRSTDFFSTLLVNNGIFGLLLFSGFVFTHFQVKISDGDIAFSYFVGLVLLFFIMMATVPEFAYPSLWIYLALAYVFHEKKSYTDE